MQKLKWFRPYDYRWNYLVLAILFYINNTLIQYSPFYNINPVTKNQLRKTISIGTSIKNPKWQIINQDQLTILVEVRVHVQTCVWYIEDVDFNQKIDEGIYWSSHMQYKHTRAHMYARFFRNWKMLEEEKDKVNFSVFSIWKGEIRSVCHLYPLLAPRNLLSPNLCSLRNFYNPKLKTKPYWYQVKANIISPRKWKLNKVWDID